MFSSVVEDTVGFEHVDAHVTNVMIAWIGGVVEQTCRELLALQLPDDFWKTFRPTVMRYSTSCAFNHKGSSWHVEPAICLTCLLWFFQVLTPDISDIEFEFGWKTQDATWWSDCNDTTWISMLQCVGQLYWMASWWIYFFPMNNQSTSCCWTVSPIFPVAVADNISNIC